MIDESVLRENDIRGIYGKNITEELAFKDINLANVQKTSAFVIALSGLNVESG